MRSHGEIVRTARSRGIGGWRWHHLHAQPYYLTANNCYYFFMVATGAVDDADEEPSTVEQMLITLAVHHVLKNGDA